MNKTLQSKHLLFSVVFFSTILLSTSLFSQTNSGNTPKKMKLGFKTTTNFINSVRVIEGNTKNNGNGFGFGYGLMGDFSLGSNYAFSTELMITSFHNKISVDGSLSRTDNGVTANYTNIKYDYRLQYLQIPLSLKFNTNEIGDITYWGQFGIAPSILISNRVTGSADQLSAFGKQYSPNSTNNNKFDFNGEANGTKSYQDNINSIRIPLIIGIGIEYNISGNTRLVGGLRLDKGFTDISNDKNTSMNNSALGLVIGVFF